MRIGFGPEIASRASRPRRELGGGLSIRLAGLAAAAALGTAETASSAAPGALPGTGAQPSDENG